MVRIPLVSLYVLPQRWQNSKLRKVSFQLTIIRHVCDHQFVLRTLQALLSEIIHRCHSCYSFPANFYHVTPSHVRANIRVYHRACNLSSRGLSYKVDLELTGFSENRSRSEDFKRWVTVYSCPLGVKAR